MNGKLSLKGLASVYFWLISRSVEEIWIHANGVRCTWWRTGWRAAAFLNSFQIFQILAAQAASSSKRSRCAAVCFHLSSACVESLERKLNFYAKKKQPNKWDKNASQVASACLFLPHPRAASSYATRWLALPCGVGCASEWVSEWQDAARAAVLPQDGVKYGLHHAAFFQEGSEWLGGGGQEGEEGRSSLETSGVVKHSASVYSKHSSGERLVLVLGFFFDNQNRQAANLATGGEKKT